MKNLIACLLLVGVLLGCKSIDKAVLTEVKTADGQTVMVPNPIIVGTASTVGPALGPYGVAGSAVVVSGISLWAAQRRRRLEKESKADAE